VIPIDLIANLVVVVGTLLALSLLTIVGSSRLRRAVGTLRQRVHDVYPYVGLLAVILVVNSAARVPGESLSWLLDWNITGLIYTIEGEFVATLQAAGSPVITAVLSSVYIYGYVFLLVFPILAYFALDDLRSFRHTMLSYGFNYAIGIACYILFIAYGPRNLMPELVDSLLYTNWPRAQLLTSEVNSNTNVFPSLHTSLSVTVVVLAYRTRKEYPAWLALSTPIAASVIVSTMYLGIHWAVDVVAGVVLGIGSVLLAEFVTDDRGKQPRVEDVARRFVATAQARVGRWRSRLAGGQSRES
jgi:membrane-associated phospholipid phosphatase